MPQPRYPANPNQIRLNLDFDTIDRLRTRAKERNSDLTRCAYELLQEALGIRPPPVAAPPAEPESDTTFDWRRAAAQPKPER